MGKAVFLMSGGIDSPVAAYLGITKGWEPLFLYFDNAPFAGEDSKKRALMTINRVIAVTGVKGRIAIAPHGKDLEEITRLCRRNMYCLLCKRMMYRKAERLAQDHGCDAIVTGEILGEQASQTMRNLVVDSSVVKMPIIRPIIGYNKLEVEAIARRIGTFTISQMRAKPCSASAIKARTRSNEEEVRGEEAKIDPEGLIQRSMKDLKVYNS
uniref:Thil AANH domain-containing protein n=1 Tax=Candidatus Methanomethylicus mesodigestus TaxID=1867258 RepID=A0A7C3IY47_9CREN